MIHARAIAIATDKTSRIETEDEEGGGKALTRPCTARFRMLGRECN